MTAHAFLITAYNDFDILIRGVRLYSKLGDVYIHVDKKSDFPEKAKKELLSIGNVEVITKYKIYWGSYKHILAVLSLAETAAKKRKYDFYHVLSGNAFPCVSKEEFFGFFEENLNKSFMEIIPVDDRIKERYERFFFLHRYDGKGEKGKRKTNAILSLQKKLGIKSKRSFLCRGYFYCHLSGDFMDYVLDYVRKNKGYLRSLKTCFIPEEFFFQNIIYNSEFYKNWVNDHLIYNVWDGLKGSPEELTEKDFGDIINSKKPFCRKIGKNSLSLIDKIEERVSHEK